MFVPTDKFIRAARIINSAGSLQVPLNDTVINILKHILREDELDLIFAFKGKVSQTLEQLKLRSKLSEEEILKKIDILGKKGVIFYQPNRYGVMIYRLLPFQYIYIYLFMSDLDHSDCNIKLAELFDKMYDDLGNLVQNIYDSIVSIFQELPPFDRIFPILINKKSGREIEIIINEELEVPVETILPKQRIEEIIENFKYIAVGNCYCRNLKDLLGDPCKIDTTRKVCFVLGKSARYSSEQGFTKLISKSEALKILKNAEKAGLVHKTLHVNNDINNDVLSICNCCNCCCEASRANLKYPFVHSTNYLAKINQNMCKGSAICVEKCSNEAIILNDDKKAEINKEYCIGCGVCAYFCPEGAISMLEGPRVVRILPPRRIL